MNNNGLVLDGLQMSTIAKITERRVSKITMTELKTVLSAMDKDEAKFLLMAIRSRDSEKIQAAFDIPIYRVIEKMVSNEQKARALSCVEN